MKKHDLFKAICTTLIFVFITSHPSIADNKPDKSEGQFENINPENITIVRDQWGVPHIYGKTDAEAAYGLAWANAEDDFHTMQELLLAGTGNSGRDMGQDGAVRDFLIHALNADDLVESQYDTALSDEFKEYLNGYVQGINAYAEKHPEEVRVRKVFPVTSKDILKSYVFALSAVSGVIGPVKKIVSGDYDKLDVPFGSNAFAFNSHKTEDGSQILVINPHQPVEGPFSWYEAHLNSEEGLNILGAMFPGGMTIFLGSNPNLGWAHTFNDMDLVDVFKLEMHPDKKLTYQFDGEWLELEKRKVWLKVKIKKWLPPIPVRKTTYWSKYGATLESENGEFYSIRFPANMDIRAGEQMYRMNKASNFTEFYDAVSMHASPRYNIIYADRHDTISYINYAKVPKRDTTEHYDWSSVVPGNTSKTLWTDVHPLEFMPTYINPDCGYVFNTNNTPFNATCSEENPDGSHYPYYMGFEPGDNNRSTRFMELIAQYNKVDFEDVVRIKFDKRYPDSSAFLSSIEEFNQIEPSQFPEISQSLEIMRNWDRVADKDSEEASLFLLTYQYIFDKEGGGTSVFMEGLDIEQDLFVEAVTHAQEHLKKYFNSVKVKLGDLQRHIRGDKSYALAGFPDMLAANYDKPTEGGKLKPWVGDSYVQIVQYNGEDGMRMETLHPFGASCKPGTEHYTDQMVLYANHELKKMTLNKEEIFENAEKIYHPK